MVGYSDILVYLQTYGVLDFLLPFILIFTVVYAVLSKSNLLGDKKQFNVIIALVLGILFVAPHITGGYPLGYDPIVIINQSLPSVALVAVAAIMLLFLMEIFGTGFADAARPLIALAAIVFVLYIFGSSLGFWVGPYDLFSWWTTSTTELMVTLLVFGVIVWLIVKEPSSTSLKNVAESGFELIKKLFR